MSQLQLRKYAVLLTTAKAISFDLFEVDGIDFRTDATFESGDIKISKDGGAEVNTTNLPTDEGQGYRLILTATELTASRIRISIADITATKVWLDTTLIIETYGNASAMHAFDLDSALVTLAAVTHTGAIIPTVSTLTGHTAQTGDSFARIGVAGAGLTNIDLPNQSFDLTGNITGNLSGSVGSVTAAVTVGTMNANVINAASIAASAMNGKGDWNIGKTGYSLTQSFPSNFASMVISGAGATDSLIQGYLNTLIVESTAGNIAANFDNFYDNGDALTARVVDDVGAGSLFPAAGWLWSTATSGVPNPGRIRGNNATIASITELSIHRETDDGRDAGIIISALRSGDRIGIFFEANPDVFLIFDVTATPILTGSVFAVTGTVDSSAGTFVNTSVTVGYQITGNAAAAVQNRQEMDDNSVDLNTLVTGQTTINNNVLLTALASVCTEARLAELDAANLPAGVDGIQSDLDNATDGLGAIKTAVDAVPTAVQNRQEMDSNSVDLNTLITGQITVAEIFAGGDIDGFSLEEAQKLILSSAVGILAGAATNSITIQAADGSKTRITATVDSDGNRSAVVKDVTG